MSEPCTSEPVVLLIMDGVGDGLGDVYDAVATARTPNLDRLSGKHLRTSIFAHGTHVGLLSNTDMGNSEVGHNIMGAGRVFDQGAKRVDLALAAGELWTGVWRVLVARLRSTHTTLHLIGLLSDGNIHASTDHLYALLEQTAIESIRKVRVHILLDGRDVPDHTALDYVHALTAKLAGFAARNGVDYRIASGGGRMTTTMDRYGADWRVVERGWKAHVVGSARPFQSAELAIETMRAESPDISDQWLDAFTVVEASGAPVGPIVDGDAVVLYNFRGDRAIELAQAFVMGHEFTGFDRVARPDVLFAGITLYDSDTNMPPLRLMVPPAMPGTVSEHLAAYGITQLACSETQKYGHVTYFWNGNRSDRFDPDLEDYIEIPSDRVPFEQRPWMKTAETADVVIAGLAAQRHQFIRANFAGGDMVAHTSSFESTVIALEAIDLAIGRIIVAVANAGGCLIITADHGNAEEMVERDEHGAPVLRTDGTPRWKSAHTVNQVPLVIADFGARHISWANGDGYGLANLGATILTLFGIPVPDYYLPSIVTVGPAL